MTAPRKAKADAWMPLWIADYMADTGHLGAAEHGAYLMLIMHYWRTRKPLPAAPSVLARLARMSDSEWETHSPTILGFFDQNPDGTWTHGRIERELSAALVKSTKARASAEARWGKGDEPPVGVDPEALLAAFEACERNAIGYADADANASPKHMLGACSSPSPSPDEGSKDPPSESRATNFHSDFAEWWSTYPHRVSRPAAKARYAAARHRGISAAAMLAGARRYAVWGKTKPKDQKFMNPANWIDNERWDDELAPGGASARQTTSDADVWDIKVKMFRPASPRSWIDDWGPRPDQPGCRAPLDVLIRHGWHLRGAA